MKKILSVLLLACMLVGMLAMAGCKPAENNGASANFVVPEGGYDGSEVTITFSHTMGAKLQEVLNYHIGEFNKIYPNITVEHSSAGGWSDIAGQINTQIAGNNQPNIAYCYPDHVAMYNIAKAVVTLDNLIADKNVGLTAEQIADFIPGFYNEGKQYGDGLMYTMPMSKSTEVLYYNKTFFAEHNLTVPTTWAEMETLCKQILAIDPTCIPLGYDSEDNWFITMCEQMGTDYTSATGDHYLFDNAENHNFVKMLRQWYQDKLVTTESLYGAYTSGLFTNLDPTTARSYMCIGSSGGASYQIPADDAFEVGVAPIPQYNAEKGKVISQGPSLCILKGKNTTDQQIVASWLFVKYLTTNMAFQTEFSSTSGYMPVIQSAQQDETYAAWLAKADGKAFLTALVVKVGLEQAQNYFTSPAFNGSSVARTQVGALLVKCMSTETSDVDGLIASAFKDAVDECEFLGG